jgi:hypothetical protein
MTIVYRPARQILKIPLNDQYKPSCQGREILVSMLDTQTVSEYQPSKRDLCRDPFPFEGSTGRYQPMKEKFLILDDWYCTGH